MENLKELRSYLGDAKTIGNPKSELDFVELIRRGLPSSAFARLRHRTKLSEETICTSLRIAKRTAARRKSGTGRLKPAESELLFRLAKVAATAVDLLGSDDKAKKWMTSANRALGGANPIDLLDTGLGFKEVMDVLGRMEYGVYS